MLAALQNKKILITREKNQANIFSEKVLQYGGIPIEIPLLKITCKDWMKQEQFIGRSWSKYQWIFFTSANGVDCFFQQLQSYEINMLKTCNIAVVGHKTEISLKKYGFMADFIPTTYNADVMASEFLMKYPKTNLILLVRGNRSRSVLLEQFTQYGLPFETVEVYETTYNYAQKQMLHEGFLHDNIDVITFTSPSTVNAFMDMTNTSNFIEKARNKICLCIGTTTEKRAREQGFKMLIVPDQFTIEGMIACLIDYLATKG